MKWARTMSCSDDEEYSDEEKWVCKEMVSSAKHFTTLELDGAETVDRYLSCPVCLSLLRNPTATECLHRFCEECIQMCLRMGKNECPSCRFPIKTKRSLRPDHMSMCHPPLPLASPLPPAGCFAAASSTSAPSLWSTRRRCSTE